VTSINTDAGKKRHLNPPRISDPKVLLSEPQPSPTPRPAIGLAQRLLRHPMRLDAALLLPMFFIVTMQAPIGATNPIVVAIIASSVTAMVARRVGVYAVGSADCHTVAWKRGAAALSASAGMFLLVVYVTNVPHDHRWLPLAAIGAVAVLAMHRFAVSTLGSYVKTLPYVTSRLALLGETDAIAEFDRIEPRDPRRLVVHRTSLDTYDDVRPALRHVDQIIGMVKRGEVDRVVVLATAPGIPAVNAIVRRCSVRGVGVDLLTGAARVRPSRLEIGNIHGFSTMHIGAGLQGKGRVAAKRVFDLIIASIALVALSPVMVVAAVAVKAGSSGPIFFKQRRLGRGGQQFEMIKFRSMLPDADKMILDLTDQNEADGPLFKMKNDPRVTRVGSVMRRTSIDELPQLWNVLRGQMSLVGPRPALASEADSWPIELFDRLEAAPGITGMWQVSGRSDASFADYERLDLYYVDNWTIGLDIAILARTIPALLGRGAY
jgi:exopolysaccharide biosynthesis polyprenyl glycosylphosphotransferase